MVISGLTRKKCGLSIFRPDTENLIFQLDGFVENVINFALGKNEILKANFNLNSKNIELNEFAVYALNKTASAETKTPPGVILIPSQYRPDH